MEWHLQGACRPVVAQDRAFDTFFGAGEKLPMRQAEVTRAKSICALCPVRRLCLEYALDAGERWGVWGGHTAAERKRAIMRFGSVEAAMAAYDNGELDKVVRRR